MNPLMANSQPSMNPYATPMTLGTKLIAMDEFARSPAQAVPVDVWAGVLDVYHSHNMSASHLPQLPVDRRTPIMLKSKDKVLHEVRTMLDMDAYRVTANESAKLLRQADIHVVRDRLPDMVGRGIISSDPADALMLSARRCLDGISSRKTSQKSKAKLIAFDFVGLAAAFTLVGLAEVTLIVAGGSILSSLGLWKIDSYSSVDEIMDMMKSLTPAFGGIVVFMSGLISIINAFSQPTTSS